MGEEPASRLEQSICSHLRRVLSEVPVDHAIAESDQFKRVLLDLEYYLPELLSEIHQEWDHECLDGVFPVIARRIGQNEIELSGGCILITDQTLVPFQLRLQLSALHDAISWLEFRLGEKANAGMRRAAFSSTSSSKRIAEALDGTRKINWAYEVGFGVRQD